MKNKHFFDVLTVQKTKYAQAFNAMLQTMQHGPCGPARKMSLEMIKELKHSMISSYWNGVSMNDLYLLWTEYSVLYGTRGIPMCMFFPYPKEVDKYYEDKQLVEANDTLYCFLVRTLEKFISLDKENYSKEKILNPYHEKYYFEIGQRPTFLLCMTKTIDWVGRHIDSPKYACIIVQDHAMFPSKEIMQKLRPQIRTDKNNVISCPFHKKKIIAYPQEMPFGTEFSEMHITRMDDMTGREIGSHPDSRLFYKQLPGLGLYSNLQLSDLEKVSKEEFTNLIKRD